MDSGARREEGVFYIEHTDPRRTARDRRHLQTASKSVARPINTTYLSWNVAIIIAALAKRWRAASGCSVVDCR